MRSLKCTVTGGVLLVLVACSSSAQAPKQMSATDVVATVGSTPITLREVDDRAFQRAASDFGGARLVQALYLARREALEEIISTRLINDEAKARGIDAAKLIEQEISSHAPTPTEDDIAFWYQTNPGRVQGATLAQVHDPIKSLLIEQRMSAAHDAFIGKLREKVSVTVSLEPPRQKVDAAGHPAKGPKDAPIELIEFSDFQCPFCQRANPTVEQVLKTYGNKIHFVYRHYPLPNHPNARPAAEAAACADEQGRFWQFHDELFGNPNKLTNDDLKQHAVAAGLDATRFNACFDGHRFKNDIDKDLREGNEAGVSGTPAFFINGRSLEGAQPFESFKRVIDEELAAGQKR
jgi:protein-disulfide isomerase